MFFWPNECIMYGKGPNHFGIKPNEEFIIWTKTLCSKVFQALFQCVQTNLGPIPLMPLE